MNVTEWALVGVSPYATIVTGGLVAVAWVLLFDDDQATV